MIEKTIQSRIILKHDTTANWVLNRTFIPKRGEFIVFEDGILDGSGQVTNIDENGRPIPGVKVGDGSTYVVDLPFLNTIPKEVMEHINNLMIHVSEEDRIYWNHKIDCEDTVDEDTLILFR